MSDVGKSRQSQFELALRRIRNAARSMEAVDDWEDVLHTVVEELSSIGVAFRWASVLLANRDEGTIYGFGRRYLTDVPYRVSRQVIPNPMRRAMDSGEVVYRPDVWTEDPYGELDRVRHLDIHSIIDVPFDFGTIGLSHTAPNAFSDEDIDILTQVAEALSDGFHRVKTLETLEQRNRELEASRQSLEESDERVRALLNATTDSVLLLDREGRFLVLNETVARGLGRSVDELLGVCVYDLLPPDLAVSRKAQIEWVFRSGQPVRFEDRSLMQRVLDNSVYPIPDARGKVIAVAVYGRDITERKEAEEELRGSEARFRQLAQENAGLLEQAQRDAEIKSALLQEVNHRVKNNLSAIIGLLYAERHHAPMEHRAAYQSITQDLVNRVQGLVTVHSLLSASEWAPLSLSELATQVIQTALQMLPRDKRAAVEVTPSPIRVTSDQAQHLALVINELTTNTIKHTLQELDTVQIRVCIISDDAMVRFEFRDDGPGYPEEVLRLEGRGVGFELIQNVVRKGLHGELSLDNDDGAVGVLRFRAAVQENGT